MGSTAVVPYIHKPSLFSAIKPGNECKDYHYSVISGVSIKPSKIGFVISLSDCRVTLVPIIDINCKFPTWTEDERRASKFDGAGIYAPLMQPRGHVAAATHGRHSDMKSFIHGRDWVGAW